MPITVSCPQCQATLKAPDQAAGKKVKCPKCANPFVVTPNAPPPAPPQQAIQPPPVPNMPQPPVPPQPPAPPQPQQSAQQHIQPGVPAAPMAPQPQMPARQPDYQRDEYDDDYDDDRPRRRKRKRPRRGAGGDWSKVRTGMTLAVSAVFTSFATGLLGCCGSIILAGALVGMAGSAAQNRNAPDASSVASVGVGFVILLVLIGLGYLIAFVLHGTGNFLCISAPARGGSKMLAMSSSGLLGLSVLSLLATVVVAVIMVGMSNNQGMSPQQVMQMVVSGGVVVIILYIISLLASFAHMVVFQFFLLSAAKNLDRPGIATSVIVMLIEFGIFVLAYLTSFVISIATFAGTASMAPSRNMEGMQGVSAAGGVLQMLCSIVFMFALLVWIVHYIVNLFLVRSAAGDA